MTTFATPNPIVVAVDIACGDVAVIAADRTDSVVSVRPGDRSRKRDVRAAAVTAVEFDGAVLSVRTPRGLRGHSPFGGVPSVRVTIEVPAGSRVTGASSLGTLRVAGELADCELSVAAGDIVVDSPSGAVNAKAGKGDIRVHDAVRGELRLETAAGGLEIGIRPGSAARLEATTAQGAVRNQLDPVAQPSQATDTVRVHARTSCGDIVVAHAAA
jgi:hypothetical protein